MVEIISKALRRLGFCLHGRASFGEMFQSILFKGKAYHLVMKLKIIKIACYQLKIFLEIVPLFYIFSGHKQTEK